MTKEIQSITDPAFINATILALNQDIIRIIEKTDCEFKAQVLDDCNYRIEEARKKQLNFTDMIDSEEILNDLRGKYEK
jgi:hypothetical protein